MADPVALIDELTTSLEDGKSHLIDLVEFMKTGGLLFEEGVARLQGGSGREKDEFLRQIVSLQDSLTKDVEFLIKETGKSPEQLLSYTENPDNFSPEAWEVIQKTWRRLSAIKPKKKKPNRSIDRDQGFTSGW